MKHFSNSYDHGIWAVEAVEPEAEIK